MRAVTFAEDSTEAAQLWDGRLGDLLAAIGNHEGKALTFLAMQDGVAYGVTSIYRRFLEIQGSDPGFVGRVTTAQKYVVHSFAPIGLVALERNEGGFLRHVKHDPDKTAAALAGFLLAYTEKHPAALTQIFASTATNGFAHSSDRPPIRRMRILRVLARRGADLHSTELAALAAVNDMSTSLSLTAFDRAGLLEYHSFATYEMRTVYGVDEPVVFPRRGNTALRDAIADYLNARLHRAGGPAEVSREEIEAHLVTCDEYWRTLTSLRDNIQKIMKILVNREQVRAVSSHYGPNHSQLVISEVQQEFLIGLVDGVDAIAAGDPEAIAAGIAAGEEILDDPQRVSALMRRCFAASKLASNPLSGGRKLREVREAIERAPGSTSAELLAALGSSYTKQLVLDTLNHLVRQHTVYGITQPDGPYKRWYLSESLDEASDPPAGDS